MSVNRLKCKTPLSVLISFVYIDFWTFRHFYLHLYPERGFFPAPRNYLNPETLHKPNPKGAMLLLVLIPAVLLWVVSIEESRSVLPGLDLILLKRGYFWKEMQDENPAFREEVWSYRYSHSCETSSSGILCICFWACASQAGPQARVPVEFSVCQIFSCLETQTEEMPVLASHSGEPPPHPRRFASSWVHGSGIHRKHFFL